MLIHFAPPPPAMRNSCGMCIMKAGHKISCLDLKNTSNHCPFSGAASETKNPKKSLPCLSWSSDKAAIGSSCVYYFNISFITSKMQNERRILFAICNDNLPGSLFVLIAVATFTSGNHPYIKE